MGRGVSLSTLRVDGPVSRDDKVQLAANVLMGTVSGVVLFVLGAPLWAAVAFGYVFFLLARLLQ